MLSSNSRFLIWFVRVWGLGGFTYILYVAIGVYQSGLWTSFSTWLFASLCCLFAGGFMVSFLHGKRKWAVFVVAMLLCLLGMVSAQMAHQEIEEGQATLFERPSTSSSTCDPPAHREVVVERNGPYERS